MPADPEAAWESHSRQWRDPAQITSQWEEAATTDPSLLAGRARGRFWEAVAETGACLLVSREYEHLLMGLTVVDGRPRVSYMRMPHPSGIAIDASARVAFVASTRNPNQVYELRPATGALRRADSRAPDLAARPLVPVASRFYPGSLYIHDLALIGAELHANAVAHNAVVRLTGDGQARPAWWPRSVERRGRPDTSRNYLQLNSIAAGPDLTRSFFSASVERPGARRPGQRNFAVDGRGVVFSGETREPSVRGLTRPHSARLHRHRLWIDNSGYGELVTAGEAERFETVARLPGWTRGLAFAGRYAFVATSRVIPRFRSYAPGLDVDRSVCGLHVVDLGSGTVEGSLVWPAGNQVFAVEVAPARMTLGFPFTAGRRPSRRAIRDLFYSFTTERKRSR